MSGNGHAIDRNYEISSLQSGDIGLHMRIDLNGVNELTDSQNKTAIAVAEGMSAEILSSLGKKKQMNLLDENSVVVSLGKDKKIEICGLVALQTEQGVRLQTVDEKTGMPKTKFCPLDRIFDEAPGYVGWNGLRKYLILEQDKIALLDFIGEADEELLVECINAITDIEELSKVVAEKKVGKNVLATAEARLLKLEHDRIVSMLAAGKAYELKQSELINFAIAENEDNGLRISAIGMINDRILLRRLTSDQLFKIQEAAEKRLLALGREF